VRFNASEAYKRLVLEHSPFLWWE